MPFTTWKVTFKDLAIGEIFEWSTFAEDSLEAASKCRRMRPLHRIEILKIERFQAE